MSGKVLACKRVLAQALVVLCLLFAPAALAQPGIPSISTNGTTFESGLGIEVRWNLWWGNQGDSWQLLDNGTVICEKTIDPVSQLPQTDSCTVDLAAGSHTLVVRLVDAQGSTDSNPVTITVQSTGSAEGVYAVTSQWPGGKIIRISFAPTAHWEAHVTYVGEVTPSIWAGTATVNGNTIVYTPSPYNHLVEGQLVGNGAADPTQSYILYNGQQIPFTEMPNPPDITDNTYYIDPADYRATGDIKIGQLQIASVWDAGPFSVVIPNERKQWAIALAHAAQIFRNVTGIEDPYVGANHYLATAIQESRVGADPESASFTYPHELDYPITYQPAADRDGFQQIEGHNGGSAYQELQALYPNRFSAISHADAVSGARFETSAITAAYYNIFMYQFLIGNGYEPGEFFSNTMDPQALDRVMALVYNRGAYSGWVDRVFTSARTYCQGLSNMADEAGECLPNTGDFGSLYVRQVPGFNLKLENAVAGGRGNYPGYYESHMDWATVDYYLDRIAILYDPTDIAEARAAAQQAFQAQSNGAATIPFSTHFGPVLDAIMLALPVDTAVNTLCDVYNKCAVPSP